jgi:hypothetical protein
MSVRSRDPAALRAQLKGNDLGFWPTPRDLSYAAIRYILPFLPPATIWECAAGNGCFAEDMRAAGHIVLASDIEPRGPGIEQRDFLRDEPPQPGLIATTNPPHGEDLLTPYIARGLQLLDGGKLAGLVLLWRWDHYQAAERVDAVNRAFRVQICCWRPTWIPGSKGNPRWSYAWIAWLLDYPGPPTLHALKESELLQAGLPLDPSAARRQWPGPDNNDRTVLKLLPEQEQRQAVLPFGPQRSAQPLTARPDAHPIQE